MVGKVLYNMMRYSLHQTRYTTAALKMSREVYYIFFFLRFYINAVIESERPTRIHTYVHCAPDQ